MNNRETHVLIAPLNWGLGHATRCIPVIQCLLEKNIKVTVAANGYGKKLLELRFPNLTYCDIPGIDIRYPVNGSMAGAMFLQMPKIISGIKKEHSETEKIIADKKVTHIISDNRYGLYSGIIKTAFMTHQVRISGGTGLKFLEPLLFLLHKNRIEKFSELWIPDDTDLKLSAKLSDTAGITIPVKHTGILSRFKQPAFAKEKKFDCIALLSGPEPQRTLFEHKVMQFFLSGKKICLLILGQPGNPITISHENVTVKSEISDDELSVLLHPETLLICRPGYSTLMDLTILRHQKVLFVPTPGQTEQEYLSSELKIRFEYCTFSQNEFPDHWVEIAPGKKLPDCSNDELLQKTIAEFIS